jgi:hypothetical protein
VREQKIKLRHGDTLIINTMEGNCMMNFFKRFIAGGFQVSRIVKRCCVDASLLLSVCVC